MKNNNVELKCDDINVFLDCKRGSINVNDTNNNILDFHSNVGINIEQIDSHGDACDTNSMTTGLSSLEALNANINGTIVCNNNIPLIAPSRDIENETKSDNSNDDTDSDIEVSMRHSSTNTTKTKPVAKDNHVQNRNLNSINLNTIPNNNSGASTSFKIHGTVISNNGNNSSGSILKSQTRNGGKSKVSKKRNRIQFDHGSGVDTCSNQRNSKKSQFHPVGESGNVSTISTKCEWVKEDKTTCGSFKAKKPPKGPHAHACARHVDAWNEKFGSDA